MKVDKLAITVGVDLLDPHAIVDLSSRFTAKSWADIFLNIVRVNQPVVILAEKAGLKNKLLNVVL